MIAQNLQYPDMAACKHAGWETVLMILGIPLLFVLIHEPLPNPCPARLAAANP